MKNSLKVRKTLRIVILLELLLILVLGILVVMKMKNNTVAEEDRNIEEPGEISEFQKDNTESEQQLITEEEIEDMAEMPALCDNTNFTTDWGSLMLINPNFIVSTDWIAQRKAELIDIEETYGIREGNIYNGAPLLDPEAATHLNEMLQAYYAYNPGHEITTRSCFRSVGTTCGRLCYATGTSDHHSGYTCDLIDDYYGDSLDTDTYDQHPDWQWLHANSYKYGFIDRFVANWAGGSMSEPVNVDENGTTGLYETWHYRYVGIQAATDIATGKYNNGEYDSLEHYLKATGHLTNLLSPAGNC